MFTKKDILAILDSRGVSLRKQLGQHFLVDKNLFHFIVKSANLTPTDQVLEIGTGIGSLTMLLSEQSNQVFTVEVDSRVQEIAKELLLDHSNIVFFLGDALENKNNLSTKWTSLLPKGSFKLVANLPYHIASPLLVLLLQSSLQITQYIVLVQKEAAERMVASPRKKNYGRLSVITQVLSTPKLLKPVPPNVFWPPPKVNSAIMELVPKKRTCSIQLLDQILRTSFSHRRKKISRTLEKHFSLSLSFIQECMSKLNIPNQARPENLSVQQYVDLTLEFSKQITPIHSFP